MKGSASICQCSSGFQRNRSGSALAPEATAPRRRTGSRRLLTLFEADKQPEGFRYTDDFLSAEEEHELLATLRSLEFHEVRMRGVAAKRRVVQNGWKYSFESFRMTQGPPLPDFLLPLRDRAERFAELAAGELSEGLLTEYTPGAAIG